MTLGLCSLLNVEISLTVVAAFLTLIGYSMNDTVVVFDRIRENREKSKRTPLTELVNHSINQTLSRTVLTSGLTFMVVVVLFFLGGEVLRGFSFVMLGGLDRRVLLDDLHRLARRDLVGSVEAEARGQEAAARTRPHERRQGRGREGEVLTDMGNTGEVEGTGGPGAPFLHDSGTRRNPRVLVIFTDLDGTLLEEDGSLSAEARAAVGALRAAGSPRRPADEQDAARARPLARESRRGALGRVRERRRDPHVGPPASGRRRRRSPSRT